VRRASRPPASPIEAACPLEYSRPQRVLDAPLALGRVRVGPFSPGSLRGQRRRAGLYEACAAWCPAAFPGLACFGLSRARHATARRGRRRRLAQGRTVLTIAPPWSCCNDGASPRGRPGGVRAAMAWALLGHGARVGPRGDGLDRLEPGLGAAVSSVRPSRARAMPQDLGPLQARAGGKGSGGALATPGGARRSPGASVAPSASQGALGKASGVEASAAQGVEPMRPADRQDAGGQAPQGAGQAWAQRTGAGVVSRRVSHPGPGHPNVGRRGGSGPKARGEAQHARVHALWPASAALGAWPRRHDLRREAAHPWPVRSTRSVQEEREAPSNTAPQP